MSKKKYFLPLTVLTLLLGLGLGACNGENNGGGNSDGAGQESQQASETKSSSAKQEKINITAADGKTKLIYPDTVQLTADQEGVTWESAKPEIATVSTTGLVTAVSKGSASIKAIKEGFRDGSINISVDYPSITVTAADNKTNLLINETVNLTASEQGVTWSSSDATIASVENGVVTAKKLGSAVITASKDKYNDGSVTINVVRPAATAVLHMEEADHYAADGEWKSSSRGPGETPIYSPSSSSPSDGTCIAYFGAGDKETLTFTSDKACKAELVLTVGYYYSITDLTASFGVKFNGADIAFPSQGYEAEGTSNYTYKGISFGEVDLVVGNNVLEINMLEGAQYYPYIDDLEIYAAEAANIAVVQAAEKDPVVVNEASLTVAEGKTVAITSSMTGLSYRSNGTSIATVDENGIVTGVKVGETTISVSKDGYKTIRVPVTVTEAEGVIAVSINEGTSEGDVITFRTSQNLSAPYNYIVDEWPEGAILTIAINNEGAAGAYSMYMRARASGGYNSSTTDDLATCMEVKVNGTAVAASGTVSGNSFTDYLVGTVNLAAGANTITIKCLTAVPTMNLLRFIPAA